MTSREYLTEFLKDYGIPQYVIDSTEVQLLHERGWCHEDILEECADIKEEIDAEHKGWEDTKQWINDNFHRM